MYYAKHGWCDELCADSSERVQEAEGILLLCLSAGPVWLRGCYHHPLHGLAPGAEVELAEVNIKHPKDCPKAAVVRR